MKRTFTPGLLNRGHDHKLPVNDEILIVFERARQLWLAGLPIRLRQRRNQPKVCSKVVFFASEVHCRQPTLN